MKTIIIDDEPKAIELLQVYCGHFNHIEVIACFRNALKALDFIQNNPIDLIFLDINMPHLSGLSLSKLINKNINVIFTTAYSEYAVESYEVNASDYLLKPISLERFTQAITKLIGKNTKQNQTTESFCQIKSSTKMYRVAYNTIKYLEKDGNYMRYHTLTENISTRESIAEALNHLPSNYIQCHKSYIININHIKYLDKDQIKIGTDILPIGMLYKQNILDKMKE